MLHGNVTAKENANYRRDHDARITFGISALKNYTRGVSLPSDGFTYGRALRPSTPISGIIRNNYGEEAATELIMRYT